MPISRCARAPQLSSKSCRSSEGKRRPSLARKQQIRSLLRALLPRNAQGSDCGPGAGSLRGEPACPAGCPLPAGVQGRAAPGHRLHRRALLRLRLLEGDAARAATACCPLLPPLGFGHCGLGRAGPFEGRPLPVGPSHMADGNRQRAAPAYNPSGNVAVASKFRVYIEGSCRDALPDPDRLQERRRGAAPAGCCLSFGAKL